MVEKGTIPSEKGTTANGPSCVARNPSGFFTIWAIFLCPLELVPASGERVVPTEWQVRYCMSRARVIPVQAPQYRQYALISDILDLTHLSIQEGAALATNWIKDRLEGLKIQNFALAAMTGPVLSSLPRNLTADVQCAFNECESSGSGQQLILHGNPSALARDFSPHMAVLRRHFFAECALPMLYVASGHPRWRFLTSLRPAAAWVPLWKTRSRPIGVRVCLVARFNFFSTAFDPREWTMVVFCKEDPRRQPQLITPCLRHQGLPSLTTLMFLLVRHHLLDRQIRLDFHQDGPQLLRLLVSEREKEIVSRKCIA